MNQKESDFLKRLLATFRVEAEEHLRAISSGLIELERAPGAASQAEIVETIFREAHSLKGAARSVNLTEIDSACQSLENVFAALKRQEVVPSPELLDSLHQAVDGLSRFLASIEAGRSAAGQPNLAAITGRMETLLRSGARPAETARPPEAEALQPPAARERTPIEERPILAETVRVAAARLDSLLLQTEELLSAKLAAVQRAAELRQIGAALTAWNREWAKVQPVVRALAQSIETTDEKNRGGSRGDKAEAQRVRLLEFAEWNKAWVESLEAHLAAVARAAERDGRALGGMVDNLLQEMKQVLMLPFSALLEVFPKLVRDLAREHGKDVELVVRGAEVEVDRRILQEIKDPLIHLVRNCIDHGIERPEERTRKNKPPRGTVTLALTPKDGNKVEVLIADDGAGIDTKKVRAAALRLGLAAPEAVEAMSEAEALRLVFQSALSTSPLITDLSGRGLGLAIVQEKVEKLGGVVSLETQPDAGTTFRLLLPLTLATFRGVWVRVNEQRFVLPAIHVERTARVSREEIQTVENRETIRLNGKPLSLVRLGEVLGLPVRSSDLSRSGAAAEVAATGRTPVVVLSSGEKRLAFLVDEVLGEQEVLVKSLGPQLARVRNIAGAMVLGAGQVVPILNASDLMKSAVALRPRSAPAGPARPAAEKPPAKRKRILVAEDSITARALLKNILEAAGYDVKTAVDGVEAFTLLKTEAFDLVVSDVDMPRLNGFDLTAKIRGDKKLAELPLVLVTALESRQDRERGIEVGANAYIVKSSFDQSNLLEVVQRLI